MIIIEEEKKDNSEVTEEVKPDVVVKTTNGVTTAEVQPVDPLAEPQAEEEKPSETEKAEEDKKDTDNLEADITNQKQAEEDIKDDLSKKGVDFDALADEYATNGELSEKSMEALNKAGYPQAMVNAYLNGLQALSDRFTSTVKSYAGGEDGFKSITEYIKTQPKEVIDAYNKTIQSGNLGQIHLMIDGLKANMTKSYGTANPTLMGNGSANNAPEGYTSMEAMTKDMADPRYQVDPAFTRKVYMKIKNATIF